MTNQHPLQSSDAAEVPHSGIDVLQALQLEPRRAELADQRVDREAGTADLVRADDAVARLLQATNASLFQILHGVDGPLGKRHQPVIGGGEER